MELSRTSRTADVHLIGVSVPRSGHNLLVRLLQALFPTDLFYCERYLVSNCCQAVPCTRRGTRRVSFQKSHDLELDLPRDVADAFYVIQHRTPMPAILSAREKYADEYGDAIAGDRDAYAVWLGRMAEYLVTFDERWVSNPPANSLVVDYDELVANPVGALQRIVGAAGIEVADAAVEAVVAQTMPRGGHFGERPFVPRSVEGSRYFDRELLATFESIVLDALPVYAKDRIFDPIEYRGTLIWYVSSALRAHRTGDADEGIRLLDEALALWPDNGMLLYEQSWLLLKQGRYAEAQRLLERAATLLPTHPPVLDLLVTAALAAGDAPAALEPMRALALDVEPIVSNQLRLAKVLAHNHDRPGAAAILDEVTRAAPQEAQVWIDLSEVRLVRSELSEARLALEAAIGLSPLRADLYARHGDVLLKLGKPHRAVDALRQSLALDPRQPAVWCLLVDALETDGDRAGLVQAVADARARFPDDAELQAAMAEARRRALAATRLSWAARALRARVSSDLPRRLVTAVGRLPELAQREDVRGRTVGRLKAWFSPPGEDALQVRQLRAALGAAELRLAEVEERRRKDLEAAWAHARRLETSLRELRTSLEREREQRQAAWAQARRLNEGLTRQARSAEAAWSRAQQLDAELRQKANELAAVRAEVRRLEQKPAEPQGQVPAQR